MKKCAILINVTLCSLMCMASESVLEAPKNEVVVEVSIEDALKSNDITTLKKELLKMQESIKLLELDKKLLSDEKAVIYREFVELNKKYEEQNESFNRLKLVVADVATSSDVRKSSEDSKLLRKIGDYSNYGGMLGLKTIEFCEFIENLLEELPIGKIRQAEILLKSEALKVEANRFTTLTDSYFDASSTVKSCRILAIDKNLQCVILSAGSIHGAFNGLIYRSGKKSTMLKVVAVRPFVAAAVVTSGNINDLSLGMEAVSAKQEQ